MFISFPVDLIIKPKLNDYIFLSIDYSSVSIENNVIIFILAEPAASNTELELYIEEAFNNPAVGQSLFVTIKT